jgi:hypothetical protein
MLYFISKKKVDELDRSVAAFERKLRRRGLNLNEELNGILNQIKFFNDNARFEAGKIIESINDQFYAVLFTSLVQNKLLKEVTL